MDTAACTIIGFPELHLWDCTEVGVATKRSLGALLSNRTRIWPCGRAGRWRGALRREFQHSLDLLAGHIVVFDDFFDAGAIFEILENDAKSACGYRAEPTRRSPCPGCSPLRNIETSQLLLPPFLNFTPATVFQPLLHSPQ
jgi:hypothetical protein